MILDILTIFLGLWLIFQIIGLFFTIKIMRDDVDEVPPELKQEFEKDYKELICFTETHNDIIYVWEKESNTFLTQGKDMEEVVKYFVKNHPNTKVLFERRKLNGI